MYQSDLKQASVNFRVDLPSVASHDQEKILKSLSYQKANLNAIEDYRDEQDVPEDNEDYVPLPDYVIRGVDRFVFFVGYPQSGHSIVASVLDAHPHVVIANEYSLFSKWQEDPDAHADKHWLFNTLYYYSSTKNTTSGRRQANKKVPFVGIPGSWQGRYDRSISVIGDKSGWKTVEVFRRNKEMFFELYGRLKKTVQVPISVIHVIRNPYDNIATMMVHKMNETEKDKSIEAQVESYFAQVHSVVDMISTLHLNVIEVHNSDMIAKPKIIIRTLCDRLRIPCSEQFLQMCVHKTFSSESKSRHLLKWTPQLIDLVSQNINEYEHLKRYVFVS